MLVSVLVFGLATIVFGLSRSFALSLVALLILGAADMISVVVRSTLIQTRTPDEMRGRVGAVNMVFIGASNELGEFESGVTAAWLGPETAVVVGGVGTVVVVVTWALLFPALRKVDRMDEE
jgi:MFS family permease